MISVAQALQTVLNSTQGFGVEEVPFLKSVGKVLKEDIVADITTITQIDLLCPLAEPVLWLIRYSFLFEIKLMKSSTCVIVVMTDLNQICQLTLSLMNLYVVLI